MEWIKLFTASSSCQNIKDAIVSIAIEETENGTEIVIKSCIRTAYTFGYWLEESVDMKNNYELAEDFLKGFGGMSATNFLDRQIDQHDLQF